MRRTQQALEEVEPIIASVVMAVFDTWSAGAQQLTCKLLFSVLAKNEARVKSFAVGDHVQLCGELI